MNSLDFLIDYWFPSVSQKAITFPSPDINFQAFWFDGSKYKEIKEKFYDLLIKYEINYLEEKNKLGLIILFDQITRNIFRDTPDAYFFGCGSFYIRCIASIVLFL